MTDLWSDDDVPVVLIFVVLGALALLSPAQADTWFHLRAGREMWTTGAFIGTERFSHTSAGVPWHNHEWLSQVLFYGVYSLGGPALLTLLTAGCAFAAALMTWRTMRGAYEWRLVLLVLLVVLLPSAMAVRPQALSLLVFVVAVQLAIRDRLAWLPPLMVIWANAHGIVLFGVLIAIVCAAEAVLWSHDRRRRTIVVAVLCSVASTASPLGWHYWPRVAQTVSEARFIGIQEYRSGFELSALPFWGLFVVLIAVVVRRARTLGQVERADRQLAMLSLVMGVASMVSIRNAPFFALAAVPALSRLTKPSLHHAKNRPAGVGAVALLVVAVTLATIAVALGWQDGGARLGWRPVGPLAARAIQMCPPPLFNTYAAGGALLWFAPTQRVFIDGRVEVYPVSLLERSRRADLEGDYQQLFDDYGIRCAVVPTDSPMATALREDQAAEPFYTDSQWTVFIIQRGL